jgi:hypothetical protein
MANFIVTNNPKHWKLSIPGIELIAARDYLMDSDYGDIKGAKIYNLCRYYKYQSTGYYVSLLSAARGHRAFPSISTILEMKSISVIRVLTEDLDKLIQHSLASIQSEKFILSIYFGRNLSKKYDNLSLQIFKQFQAPLLRAYFSRKYGKWRVQNIQLISLNDIPEDHFPYVIEFAKSYFSGSDYRSGGGAPRPMTWRSSSTRTKWSPPRTAARSEVSSAPARRRDSTWSSSTRTTTTGFPSSARFLSARPPGSTIIPSAFPSAPTPKGLW